MESTETKIYFTGIQGKVNGFAEIFDDHSEVAVRAKQLSHDLHAIRSEMDFVGIVQEIDIKERNSLNSAWSAAQEAASSLDDQGRSELCAIAYLDVVERIFASQIHLLRENAAKRGLTTSPSQPASALALSSGPV